MRLEETVMNKKMIAAIGISGALLLGSVYSISANTSGYDLYKSALKQTHTADSATLNMQMNVEDNDKSIFSVDSTFKSDSIKDVNAITTKLANDTETNTMNMYKQDGKWYVMSDKDDTIYQMDTSNSPHHKNTADLQDDMENLIGVMTKNLQQQITVTEQNNGNHSIELDLTGKDIPLTVNAFSTLFVKHAVMIQDNQDNDKSNFHMKVTIPELDHDITFKQIKVTAEVNQENYLENQTVVAVISGKDKQGTSHELELNMNIHVTDYNQTSLSPVDIPANKVVEFDHRNVMK